MKSCGHQKISSLTTFTVTARKEKNRRNMVREQSASRKVSSSPDLNLYNGELLQILNYNSFVPMLPTDPG